MKHTKREWMPLYGFLDRRRVTDHLSDMAAGSVSMGTASGSSL